MPNQQGMEKRECKHCGEDIAHKAIHANYCNASCRAQFNKKKRDHEAKMEVVQKEQDDQRTEYQRQLERELARKQKSLKKGQDANKRNEKRKREYENDLRDVLADQKQAKFDIERLEERLKDSNELIAGFNEKIAAEQARTFEPLELVAKFECDSWVKQASLLKALEAAKGRKLKNETIPAAKQDLLDLEIEQEDIEAEIERRNTWILSNEKKMERVQERIDELKKLLLPPKPQHVYAELRPFELAPKKRPKQRRKKGPKEVTGGELRLMQFNSFGLQGELGQFLGRLEKDRLAFALTGDSGAGKSNFSFLLVLMFMRFGLSAIYHSLEEGVNRLTQEKLMRFNIPDTVVFSEAGKLTDIRKSASEFDVVVVDSFTQVEAKSEDFEALRHDFPETIFIMIFQKTTSGTIRGGSSIKYNSSAMIDVVIRDGERMAIMEKSRYGTQGWEYSITNDRIVKGNPEGDQLQRIG